MQDVIAAVDEIPALFENLPEFELQYQGDENIKVAAFFDSVYVFEDIDYLTLSQLERIVRLYHKYRASYGDYDEDIKLKFAEAIARGQSKYIDILLAVSKRR